MSWHFSLIIGFVALVPVYTVLIDELIFLQQYGDPSQGTTEWEAPLHPEYVCKLLIADNCKSTGRMARIISNTIPLQISERVYVHRCYCYIQGDLVPHVYIIQNKEVQNEYFLMVDAENQGPDSQFLHITRRAKIHPLWFRDVPSPGNVPHIQILPKQNNTQL